MTSRTLPPPRRSAPRSPPAPPPSPPPNRRGAERSRIDRRYPRVLGWSIVVSILVHLVVLVVSPSFLRVGLPPGATDAPFDPSEAEGLRMVELAPGSAAPEAAPPEDRVIPEPSTTAPSEPRPLPDTPDRRPPAAERGEAPAEGAEADRPRDPLQPGYRDDRLYVTPEDLPPTPEREPTFEERHERYMEHLQARLDTYNDSIGAEAERARKATDWTVTDEDGKRWGISPGKIHLGGVTLPLPVQLGGSGERQREAAEEARQREAIQRGEETRRQREVMEERIRATREQKDAEREGEPDG